MSFLIAVATGVARALYAVIKAIVPERHKVVFLSRQCDGPSRDFLLLAAELRRRDPELEIVMRCRTLGGSFGARVASAFAMVGQMYHLASARVCVVDGYVIPVSLLDHHSGLFVIQMWHALGAIKKFGYQVVGKPGGHSAGIASAMRMHHNYDLVLCGGVGTVPHFQAAFGVAEGVVRPLGLPRVDYLLEHANDARAEPVPSGVEAMRRRFPVLAERGRTIVLYAPTFRRGGGSPYADVAERFAGGSFAVMLKPHPLETASVTGANVADVADCDILDLLPLCDVVITDYSAVAFEALVIDVPLYFYMPDIDRYREDNGLNVDPLEEYPGIASRDIDEIAGWIETGSVAPGVAARLKRDYLPVARGGCTEAIANVVLDHAGRAVRDAG
jgi:CDP-ribitol ribitolphosphotransferase